MEKKTQTDPAEGSIDKSKTKNKIYDLYLQQQLYNSVSNRKSKNIHFDPSFCHGNIESSKLFLNFFLMQWHRKWNGMRNNEKNRIHFLIFDFHSILFIIFVVYSYIYLKTIYERVKKGSSYRENKNTLNIKAKVRKICIRILASGTCDSFLFHSFLNNYYYRKGCC